ncbi:hypothetical protein C5167_014180 [Papaver somniferum]|uniref:Uncharacterized protein n=1 Tax=Papaver somniferum TaxID=3469 RepID=A0A4Y7J6D6_PAPSO|nr:hypothetical protein C5167_014180 [Papaver somniferum]
MMLGLLESLHETRLVIQGRWLSCSWCLWNDGADAAIGVMKTEVEGGNCNGGFDGAGIELHMEHGWCWFGSVMHNGCAGDRRHWWDQKVAVTQVEVILMCKWLESEMQFPGSGYVTGTGAARKSWRELNGMEFLFSSTRLTSLTIEWAYGLCKA